MGLYEIIPFENEGMSVVTGFVLFFIFVGWGSYFWWDRREHAYVNYRVEEVDSKANLLFTKADGLNNDMADMNTHIAGIHEAVEWIKKDIERKNKT